MSPQLRLIALIGLLAGTGTAILWTTPAATLAAPATGEENAARPVEPDMHEFMEYLFQPTYRRLRAAMASEPSGNPAWSAIKSDALILAEGGNLLLIRLPEEDQADWVRQSEEVRELGGQFYRAAKSRDFAAARQHYEKMLASCNACHQQFAGGEHQLTP